MPALITHHLFGEKSAAELPAGILQDQEERLAFLLGNQGPDPFFFRFRALPATVRACQTLASRMHGERTAPAFMCLRDAVGRLVREDQRIGRAFALGLLSHYTLDRFEHPFVFAEQDMVIEASCGELACCEGQVHAVIEGRIDSWMLWKERNATVLQQHPELELCRTPRIDRVAGALFSQVAWQVFGISLSPEEYGCAVNDMQAVYRIIEPAGSARGEAVARAEERLGALFSQVEALAHEVTREEQCPFCNPDHLPWTVPGTKDVSTASFMDLFDDALAAWPGMARSFSEGGEALEAAVGGINYSGNPSV